jgi:hypothetical protein
MSTLIPRPSLFSKWLIVCFCSYYSSLRLLQVFCDEAAKTARASDIVAVVEPMVATLVSKLQVGLLIRWDFVRTVMLCFGPEQSFVTNIQDANMRTNKDTSDVLLALAANKSVGCATGVVDTPLSVCYFSF